jgi:hypothetical protein
MKDRGSAGNVPGSVIDGLDANAVLGVDNLAADESHVLHGVIVAAADRADREAVPATAVEVADPDIRARVNGDAVVLVVDLAVLDRDVGRRADVERVGVVASARVTRGVVDGHAVDREVLSAVHGEDLNGRVLDRDAGDLRVDHLVSSEKLGLSWRKKLATR